MMLLFHTATVQALLEAGADVNVRVDNGSTALTVAATAGHTEIVELLKKAKMRHTKFHNLRHTFASQLLSKGANILYVSQQLGHADASITLRVYAKWIPTEGQRREMNKLPYVDRGSVRQRTDPQVDEVAV